MKIIGGKEPGKVRPALKYKGKADIMINKYNTEEKGCK